MNYTFKNLDAPRLTPKLAVVAHSREVSSRCSRKRHVATPVQGEVLYSFPLLRQQADPSRMG